MTTRIGLAIGDAAGVGPELALRVASRIDEFPGIELTLFGDRKLLARAAAAVRLPLPDERMVRMRIETVGDLDAASVCPGRWSADTGLASWLWVRRAAEAAMNGELDAIVTGPIQKEAWRAAGIRYPGHTEFLAELTGAEAVRMMLTSKQISCVLATVHIPLAEVAARLTSHDVYESIRLGAAALRRRVERSGRDSVRVTVCGLNPHAGESGMMGLGEEESVILPAIEQARSEGIEVTGPLPPDTAFVPARRRETDVYVCMYHDQGLIPLKALAFDEAVNVTLGLPLVRTSVDHGTAMDIAWQGIADDSSLCAAVRMAGELA